MLQLKSLLKQTAIYGLSTILIRLANWALTPYYSHTIQAEQIGVLADLMAMIAFINIIYMVGMETSYFRFVKERDDTKVFQSTESIVFFNSVFWSILFVLLATPITNVLKYPGKEIYIYILSAMLFFENLCNVPFAALRYKDKARKFMSIKAYIIISNIFLNIFLLTFVLPGKVSLPFKISSDPVELIFWANLIPWFFCFLYFSKNILKNISLKHGALNKEILIYSIPLIVVGTAGMINETLDRIFLKNLLPFSTSENLEQVGMYNVNYKLAIIITLAIQAFRMGAEPFFFKESKNKDSRQIYAVVMDYFVIALCVMMTITCILREQIASINHASYLEGIKILPILLLANVFLGIYYNASIWFKLTDNTKKGAIISIIGAVITVATNWYLIPVLGYVGSALAHLFCYFSMTAICVIWGQKEYPIPYNFAYNTAWILGSILYASIVFYWFQSAIFGLVICSLIYILIASWATYQRFKFSTNLLN